MNQFMRGAVTGVFGAFLGEAMYRGNYSMVGMLVSGFIGVCVLVDLTKGQE